MFNIFNIPYYLIIALQAICVIHCMRKGNQGKWIWIIVFLPVIGSIVYIFSEMITKREISSVQNNISTIINPVGRIKDLEKKLEFSPTFDNKVALADACMASGQTERAIGLYESCLTGIFDDNEYVVNKLILAYYDAGRFEDVIRIAAKIYKSSEFKKSHAHVIYALALEQTGNTEQAEAELRSMRGKFSNFEGRVNYGRFLVRRGRPEDAKTVFSEILEEASYMKSNESRGSREWFRIAKEESHKLS